MVKVPHASVSRMHQIKQMFSKVKQAQGWEGEILVVAGDLELNKIRYGNSNGANAEATRAINAAGDAMSSLASAFKVTTAQAESAFRSLAEALRKRPYRAPSPKALPATSGPNPRKKKNRGGPKGAKPGGSSR